MIADAAPRFDTRRLAKMLVLELKSEALGEMALSYDGGMGTAAVAAISAFPQGPRRDFEIALWTKRLAAGPGRVACVVRPDMTADEYKAITELHTSLMSAGLRLQ